MQPVERRHRSGSPAAQGVALTRDAWSLVLSRLDFASVSNCLRVCQQFARLLISEAVLECVARKAERDHTFLPVGFLESRTEGVVAAFKRILAPLLLEYLSLRKVALPLCDSEAELMSLVEVVGAVPFDESQSNFSALGADVALVSEPVAAVMRQEGLRTWTNVCRLDLTRITEAGCIAAFGLLPPQGQMLFLVKSWREDARVLHDPVAEGPVRIAFQTPEDETIDFESLAVDLVRDRIFLKEDKWLYESPEWQALDAWHQQRQGMYFKDGGLPCDSCIRIGGTKPFDTQGNFDVEDSERLLIQTSHPGGYLWAAFGFVISKDDLARGDYSKVASAIVAEEWPG